MSASDVNVSFQTQISSVLDALVKVAEVELTKLFQKHCQASLTNVNIDGRSEHNIQVNLKRIGETCRSIGVQVDEGTVACEQPVSDHCCTSGLAGAGDCFKEGTKEEDPPLVETNEHSDSEGSVLKEDEEMVVVCETTRNAETSTREPHKYDPVGEVRSSCSVPGLSPQQGHRPPQTKPEGGGGAQTLALCKEEKQTPHLQLKLHLQRIEDSDRAEPQQAGVGSTARGSAYRPSPSDGAVAPLRVSLWDRLASVSAAVSEPRLETTSPLMPPPLMPPPPVPQDKKLLQPCSVQLVNLALVESGGKMADVVAGGGDGAKGKPGLQTPRDLRAHQGSHTGRRLCCFTRCANGVWRLQGVIGPRHSHSCETCGKRFKRRKILRRHERFHTGEKPYRCPKCHKAFALRKSLRRHQRFHTGERPYACPHCGKTFRLRENLKAHLRFHSGEKPFACAVCAKSFRIYRNLEQHGLSHVCRRGTGQALAVVDVE